MEYVKPAWMDRPHPVVDHDKLSDFGANVAPRPLNPDQKQLQLYPTTMEIDGAQAPRFLAAINLKKIYQPCTLVVSLLEDAK